VVAELRWILLGLGVPLLVFIWWWTARRAGQTPGNAELRETTPAPDPRRTESGGDGARQSPAPRDRSVSPFEPLSIRTAEFDRVPVLDRPMMVHADSEPFASTETFVSEVLTAEPLTAEPLAAQSLPAEPQVAEPPPDPPAASPAPEPVAPAPRRPPSATTGPVADNSDRFAAPAAPEPNAAELQRIVTIRVCALGEVRWSGPQLMTAFELHGLAFGRYQVFHRKHVDGRSLFCAASLIEPGTFDIAAMAGQEFRGLTLFAVLPGPITPLETLDELLRTARGLAEELSGMIQDAKGMPLSPQRAAALREDVTRFQALLPRR
jgi:cell division protein ZipA